MTGRTETTGTTDESDDDMSPPPPPPRLARENAMTSERNVNGDVFYMTRSTSPGRHIITATDAGGLRTTGNAASAESNGSNQERG